MLLVEHLDHKQNPGKGGAFGLFSGSALIELCMANFVYITFLRERTLATRKLGSEHMVRQPRMSKRYRKF